MRRSPSNFTRLTRPPAATSLDSTTGIQYCLTSAPIGVPGPVRVKSSLSSLLSMSSSLPWPPGRFRLARSIRPAEHQHVTVQPYDVQREEVHRGEDSLLDKTHHDRIVEVDLPLVREPNERASEIGRAGLS